MSDTVDRYTRSQIMAAVRQRDTRPEMIVRRSLHQHGFRFRISDRRLPGSPDIKLTRYRVVIFVNGCFWHRHRDCRFATTPASNGAWWAEKFERNIERDRDKKRQLLDIGWRVMVVWECAVRKNDRIRIEAIDALIEWIRGGARTGMIPADDHAVHCVRE